MHRTQQWLTQDQIQLLDQLATMVEQQLADSWAWCVEDIVQDWERVMCEVERERAVQVLWDGLLALEERYIALLETMVEAQKQQAAMFGRVVEATEEDRRVLDTMLALAITFIPPTALPPVIAPPAPWQPPTVQPQDPGALGLRCSSTSSSQVPLPQHPLWVPHQPTPPAGPTTITCTSTMQPQRRSCP
ncbi:hypothetical protein Y1Q_0001025 [Alligator mississippiensis]|uniref:Uncharacterized protein n=1 Tax=Alligator mississippiensis TaxID=8496 RepID=A0A151NEB4_ALLMI|nr:hypothetical protein Y1Q_0001025 [Alligator mississippiensis]